MGAKKDLGKKLKLIFVRGKNAPRWIDIKKFSLKRARTRRTASVKKNWRRNKNKI
jgi:ribosomal protein L39E